MHSGEARGQVGSSFSSGTILAYKYYSSLGSLPRIAGCELRPTMRSSATGTHDEDTFLWLILAISDAHESLQSIVVARALVPIRIRRRGRADSGAFQQRRR